MISHSYNDDYVSIPRSLYLLECLKGRVDYKPNKFYKAKKKQEVCPPHDVYKGPEDFEKKQKAKDKMKALWKEKDKKRRKTKNGEELRKVKSEAGKKGMKNKRLIMKQDIYNKGGRQYA